MMTRLQAKATACRAPRLVFGYILSAPQTYEREVTKTWRLDLRASSAPNREKAPVSFAVAVIIDIRNYSTWVRPVGQNESPITNSSGMTKSMGG